MGARPAVGAGAGAVVAPAAVGAVPVMAAKPFSRPPKRPPSGDGLLVVEDAVLAVAGGAPPGMHLKSETLHV